jgi:type IV pilus assembly protein PilF
VKTHSEMTTLLLASLLLLTINGCVVDKQYKGSLENRDIAQAQLALGAAYLDREQLSQAEFHLQRALTELPEMAEAEYALALIEMRRENYLNAETHFIAALQKVDSYPDARNGYGVLLCKQGRLEEAQLMFQQAIADPTNSSPELAIKNIEICKIIE